MHISSANISFRLIAWPLWYQLKRKEYSLILDDDVFLKGDLSALEQRLFLRMLKGAKEIEVRSTYMKDVLVQKEISAEKIMINRPHLVNATISGTYRAIGKGAARNKVKLIGKIILSAGTLAEWNGFAILLMSMPELLKRFPFLHLVIFGEGPSKEAVETSIKNLGLGNKVSLIVSNDKELLNLYIEAADIFLLNSKDEGLSEALFRAVEHRVPIITTDTGANAEIFQDGKNALLINPNNSRQIVKAVEKLLLREDIAERLTSFE